VNYRPTLEPLEALELPGFFYGLNLPQQPYFFSSLEVDYDPYLTKETTYSFTVVNNADPANAPLNMYAAVQTNLGGSSYGSQTGSAVIPSGGSFWYTNVALADDCNQTTQIAMLTPHVLTGLPFLTYADIPPIQKSFSGSGDATVFNLDFTSTFKAAIHSAAPSGADVIDCFAGVAVQNQRAWGYDIYLDEFDYQNNRWASTEGYWHSSFQYTAPADSYTYRLLHAIRFYGTTVVNPDGNILLQVAAVPQGGGVTVYSPAVLVPVW
jgi:hypothetical protein